MTEIVGTRLVEPTYVSSFRWALVGIVVFLTLVGMALGGSDGMFIVVYGFGGLLGLMVLVPLSLIIKRVRGASVGKELAGTTRFKLVRMIGHEPMIIDTSACLSVASMGRKVSASGMAWDGEKLWVVDDGVAAAIPPEAIRTWTWHTRSADQLQVFGSGPALQSAQVQAGLFNNNASAAAMMESGFFVTVSDLKKPVWQFMTSDTGVLRRWEEAMRQIDEGRLRRAAE